MIYVMFIPTSMFLPLSDHAEEVGCQWTSGCEKQAESSSQVIDTWWLFQWRRDVLQSDRCYHVCFSKDLAQRVSRVGGECNGIIFILYMSQCWCGSFQFFFTLTSNSSRQCLSNPVQATHEFMAEWIPFKQRHVHEVLKEAGVETCCLFHDATKVFGEDRECVIHGEACEPWLQVNLFFFIMPMSNFNHSKQINSS